MPIDTVWEKLEPYIGVEHPLDEINQMLRRAVQDLRPAVVGALRLTCADESERESIDSFQRNFVQPALPKMKFWSKSPFRLANLGARYQQGAIRIAEDHFALPASEERFKVLLAKVNSHVSVEAQEGSYVYGQMSRYQTESVFCGALHAMLAGSDQAFARDLALDFQRGGIDRLRLVNDSNLVKPARKALVAAMINAQLQAQRVVEEIDEFSPKTPTVYIVVPAVTLNKLERDCELICGAHIVDRRSSQVRSLYRGLPDRPPFSIEHRFGQLRVEPPG